MKFPFKGLLFDLDGTLVDSSPVIDRAWESFATKHSLETATVLQVIQGKPAYESIKALIPCLLYTSPSPRDATLSRMPSSA